jgi:hypothetical protein
VHKEHTAANTNRTGCTKSSRSFDRRGDYSKVTTSTHLCCTSASLRPTPREDFFRVGGKAASMTITL